MLNRKLVISAAVAAAFTVIAPAAQASVDFYVNIAPPALRYEAIPAPRVGYVWTPGYWDWRNNRHHWKSGRWERQRAGYYYHSQRWVQRDNRWYVERGRWDRSRPTNDRDRDGIPNYRDRDRDNDGVSNRNDRAPDNPRRR
jgi:WXXGXW repeat (2 copies)